MGDDGGLGLVQFWDSLDVKQRHALLSIRKERVMKDVACPSCKDLLENVIYQIDTDVQSGKSASTPPGGGKLPPPVLSWLSERGDFMAGSVAHLQRRKATGFANYQVVPGNFELLSTPELEHLLLRQGPGSEFEGSREQAGRIGLVGSGGQERIGGACPSQPPQAPFPPPPPPCYCQNKLNIKFVDMLTYPRPIRKFQMLLDPQMKFSLLREMMAAEVNLDSVSMLELMIRNRRLRGECDDKTLEDLGFRNGLQVVITKVLGVPAEDQEGMNEKNKQFVGDLLFGHNNQDSQGNGGGSVVESWRLKHGYQILGRTLQALAKQLVHNQWQAEVRARENERDLLAALELEELGEDSSKKTKAKKHKRKEKERKRKQEEALKRKEADVENEKEMAERARVNQLKAESERRARHEEARRQAEEEERRLKEVLEKKLAAEQDRAAKATQERRERDQRSMKLAAEERQCQDLRGGVAKLTLSSTGRSATSKKPTLPGGALGNGPSSEGGRKGGRALGKVVTRAPLSGGQQGDPVTYPQGTSSARSGPPPSPVGPVAPPGVGQVGRGRPPLCYSPLGGASGIMTPYATPTPMTSSTAAAPVRHPAFANMSSSAPPMVITSALASEPPEMVGASPVQLLPSQPRYCSQCGSPLVAGARFCCSCGVAVMAVSVMPTAPDTVISRPATGGSGLLVGGPHHAMRGVVSSGTAAPSWPIKPHQPFFHHHTPARHQDGVVGGEVPGREVVAQPPPGRPPASPLASSSERAATESRFDPVFYQPPGVVGNGSNGGAAQEEAGLQEGQEKYKRLPFFQTIVDQEGQLLTQGGVRGKLAAANAAEQLLSRHPTITENVAQFLK